MSIRPKPPQMATQIIPDGTIAEENIPQPSLKRLSSQLRVDFAFNVCGSGGKRKREPTRSIYEEAVADTEKGRRKHAKKMDPENKAKRVNSTKTKKPETSSTDQLMMHAAESLAHFSRMAAKTEVVEKKITKENVSSVERSMLEALNRAHLDALEAKDEAIKAAIAALAAKEELVKAQAALIAMMQHGQYTGCSAV